MSDRLQWEKFWYRDFCDDLKRVPLDTRGFWIFALSEMWGQTKSEITGSFDDFSRICSCTPEEAEKAISELNEYDICDVIFSTKTHNNKDGSNGSQVDVKLRNRRLNKEEDLREYNRLAKQRWRENALKKENVKAKSPVEDRGKRIEDRGIEDRKDLISILLKHEKTFQEAYPGINLKIETAKAQAWIESNPKNKKSNLKRFLNQWLSKAQDSINKYPPREDKFL